MTKFTNYLKTVFGDNKQVRQNLRKISIFSDSSDSLLDLVYQFGKVTKLEKNDILIKEGDFDQWIYLILKGSVSAYVKDHFIAQVNTQMVGERCVLGEQRRATLKADNQVFSFGIDMALTDVLQGPDTTPELHEAFNELLLLIIKDVLRRIVDLWLDASLRYAEGSKIMSINARQQLIDALVSEDFSSQPEITAYLWSQLNKNKIGKAADFWNIKDGCLNTRKIIIDNYKNGSADLDHIIDDLIAWNKKQNYIKTHIQDKPAKLGYSVIASPFYELLQNKFTELNIKANPKIMVDQIFAPNNPPQINMQHIDNLLTINEVKFKEISNLWLQFIDVALRLNETLNGYISKINDFFGRSIVSSHPYYSIACIKQNLQREMEHRNSEILQHSILFPYIEKLEKLASNNNKQASVSKVEPSNIQQDKIQAADKTMDKDKKTAQPIADPSNFDELLKQLGATPGVPLDDL